MRPLDVSGKRGEHKQTTTHVTWINELAIHSKTHTHTYRPGSIQTRPQIEIVQQFSRFIRSLWAFYPTSSCEALSFEEYLHNQSLLLHGDEQENLRYVTKVCTLRTCVIMCICIVCICIIISLLISGCHGCVCQIIKSSCNEPAVQVM